MMMFYIRHTGTRWQITTLILTIFFVKSGFCQQSTVSLESKVDKAKITIGDRITYSIIVTRGEDVEIKLPELGANLGTFEILDYNDPEPQKINGKIIQTRQYIISTFDVGEYEIPPVTIRFTTKGDTTWQELTTEKIKIEVESLKPSEAGDIRDIKPPLELKRDIKAIIRLIIIGVIIIAIGILTFLFIKRKKEGKGLLPKRVKPPRPPHKIALEELDKLVSSNLTNVKQFYIQLSEIIRKYIESRFYIVALEMTTFQLIQNMNQTEIDSEIIELTAEFLESCDLVKFAKYIPTDQENQQTIQQAYDIVNKTKIELPEVEEQAVEPEKQIQDTSTDEQTAAIISETHPVNNLNSKNAVD